VALDPIPWRNKGPEMLALACFILLSWSAIPGCSSPEEATQETPTDATTERQEVRFEVRTDTVVVVKPDEAVVASPAPREAEIRFAVQIGAFRDPENARSVGDAARGRFSSPVTNNYDTESGLYLVRVGAFETRDQAHELRVKMQRAYPKDYRDCWIVQVKGE